MAGEVITKLRLFCLSLSLGVFPFLSRNAEAFQTVEWAATRPRGCTSSLRHSVTADGRRRKRKFGGGGEADGE